MTGFISSLVEAFNTIIEHKDYFIKKWQRAIETEDVFMLLLV